MFLQVSWFIYFIYSVNACNHKDYSLVNKTVMVTGGARGIGYAIADNFLAQGVKTIIILDKNTTNGPIAAKKLNCKYGCNKAVFIRCHVFKNMQYWDKIAAQYKTIDVLVNNAGVLNEYDITEVVQTNVAALIAWSFKFRDYNRIDRNGNGGTIINISSRFGYTVSPFSSTYSATKYAIKGFTQNFGHVYNCKRTGIRVVGICPDFTYTAMTRQQMVEDDQVADFKKIREKATFQTADEVGKAVVKVYKTAATGTLWAVSGGKLFEAPVIEYITEEEIQNM